MDNTRVASMDTINSYNVSQEYYRQEFNAEFTSKLLPVKIIFGLTAVVGCISNMFVVYIYGMKYKPCNFKYFLFVLGVIGLGQCAVMLPTQMTEMHYWFVFPASWLCRLSAYVFGYTVITCYLVLLLIAVDRFRKVCRPYGWQIRAPTARALCYLAAIVSLVFAMPPGIVSGHHNYVTPYHGANITVTVCFTADMYKDKEWPIYFLMLFGGTPVTVIIVVTCVLYGLILLQFWNRPKFRLKNIYRDKNISKTQTAECGSPTRTTLHTNGTTMSVSTQTREETQSETKSPLKNIFAILNKSGSVESNEDSLQASSGPLKSSGSAISRCTQNVRRKLMRKTFIVLIITIGCILAIIITFCLHIFAEEINRNALSIPAIQLNAFVLFHRGSFSIICAIFPVVYGIRDQKFRQAFFGIFGKAVPTATTTSVTLTEVRPND